MKIKINPSLAKGVLKAPSSKSIAHRVLIALFLSGSKDLPSFDMSNDLKATLDCLSSQNGIYDAEESGSTLRFLIPLISVLKGEGTFMGTKKLFSRGLDIYLDIFKKQGISYTLTPSSLSFKGYLKPDIFVFPGNISSQYVTGLLFALPLLSRDSEIILTDKVESNNYIEESNNTTQIFRITYPNLKRYRQKSEPNLRIDMTKIKINDEINKDIAKIKYPLIKNCNTNLSKFKTLEETIKTENSNKRMITNLLNKQKNPELKEILSNLQNTINKFSKYEETKEYNYLSTLPANNLSPFEAFKFENKNLNNNNLNFKLQTFNYNYSTEQTNYNKKMEKFKSTFNDFKKIIQGKNKSKNILVNQQRNDNKNHLNTRIIYSSLSPVNNLENDIFILES